MPAPLPPAEQATAAVAALVARVTGASHDEARSAAAVLVDQAGQKLAAGRAPEVTRAGGFDPAKHPRIPHGRGGGEFTHAAGIATPGPVLSKPLAGSVAGTVAAESVDHDTVSRYMNPDGTWKPDRQALHDRIIAGLLDSHKPQDHPVLTFMGGGSASGKSSVIKPRLSLPDAVTIDADGIKGMLPDYQQRVKAGDETAAADAHEESSYLAKVITAEAQRRKMNVLVNGVGDDSPAKMQKKIRQARQAGYKVNGAYVTLETEEAVSRAEARGKKEGRVVYPSVIRANHKGVSQVFPELVKADAFDQAELWDNNGSSPVLVGAKPPGGTWQVANPAAWQQFLAKGAVTGPA